MTQFIGLGDIDFVKPILTHTQKNLDETAIQRRAQKPLTLDKVPYFVLYLGVVINRNK